MNENRAKKLNKLLVVEIAKALKDEVEVDLDTIITVVGVEISPTLEHATCRISILPESKTEKVLERIGHKIYLIQQILNKRLNLRKVPKIRFTIDSTEARAARIEELLEQESSKL